MRLSSRVAALGGKTVSAWDIHFRAAEAARRGEDVIMLSVGDPDFDSPKAAVAAAQAALVAGDTHYTEIPGRAELRAALAARHQAATGVATSGANVIVAGGAQNALFSALLCLLDPGDEAIALDPAYLTYEASVGASGARMVRAASRKDAPFRPDIAAIGAAASPHTRVILLANPSNPSGVALTPAEAEGIAEFARERDCWLVVDEVYATLSFDRPHVSLCALPGMAERTVTISSLSKSHAMSGWRVGWAVGPEPLIAAMGRLAIAMIYGSPGFVMAGALAALQEGEAEAAAMRAAYIRRRDLMVAALGAAPGLKALKPEAGMFVLVDVRGTGLSTHDFVAGLFEAEKVSALDGHAFGDDAAGYVRLCLCHDEARLEEACRRIARYAARLAAGPARAAE